MLDNSLSVVELWAFSRLTLPTLVDVGLAFFSSVKPSCITILCAGIWISSDSMASTPYIRENDVAWVDVWGVILYAQSTSFTPSLSHPSPALPKHDIVRFGPRLTVLFLGTHTRTSQWVTHPRNALARTCLTLEFRWNSKPVSSQKASCYKEGNMYI